MARRKYAPIRCEFCFGTFTPDRYGKIGWHICIPIHMLSPEQIKAAARRTWEARTKTKTEENA